LFHYRRSRIILTLLQHVRGIVLTFSPAKEEEVLERGLDEEIRY